MRFDDIVKKRRSIRSYKDIPLDKSTVMKILLSATNAPSSGNIQNWRFIIVTDFEKRQKISHICHDQIWMQKAPVHIVVCADTSVAKKYYGIRGERLYSVQNCAAAVENMILKAVELSVDSCWVSAFEEVRLKNLLDIPDSVRPQTILTLGYGDETVLEPTKHDPATFVFFESYGTEVNPLNMSVKRRNYRDVNQTFIDKTNKLAHDIWHKWKVYYKKLLK